MRRQIIVGTIYGMNTVERDIKTEVGTRTELKRSEQTQLVYIIKQEM